MNELNPQYVGSRFEDFLAEEGILEEVTAVAVKRVLAWQIEESMKQKGLTKTAMAARMHTSRASLNRLLDEEDTSLTLTTLAKAAAVLGKGVRILLVDPEEGGGDQALSKLATVMPSDMVHVQVVFSGK